MRNISTWRDAKPIDDEGIVDLCLALYREDPGERPVDAGSIRRTLAAFRERPARGRVLALEVDRRLCGYVFLVPYWSNELGGELCCIDEIYVSPGVRGQGYARGLIEGLVREAAAPTSAVVALALEVTPGNERARAFYERLGFRGRNRSLRRFLSGPAP